MASIGVATASCAGKTMATRVAYDFRGVNGVFCVRPPVTWGFSFGEELLG